MQIQRALRGRRVCDAIGLYKAARDLWPESSFGEDSFTPEQDIPVLKEIFEMNLIDMAIDYDAAMKATYGVDASAPDTHVNEEEHISVSDTENKKNHDDDEKDSEDEEERPKYRIAEINFDFNDYVANFTKPDIINWFATI